MKKSVGVVVVTDLPEIGIVAVLQRRGFWNFEKKRPETWPGGCQVTAHGGVEEGEDLLDALRREVVEELGPDFMECVFAKGLSLQIIDEQKGAEEEVATWGIFIPHELLSHVRLRPDSGGLRFVLASELSNIKDLKNFDRRSGVPNGSLAMFKDEKRAVETALKQLV